MNIHHTIKRNSTLIKILLIAFAFASLVPALTLLLQKPANAASLTDAYIRLDRMRVSTTDVNTLVVFTVPAGNAATEDRVRVTFPSSTYITVDASPTVSATGCPAGVTALPGTLSAAGSGQAVTVTGVTNLSASTAYCFFISTGIDTTATPIPNSPESAGVTTIETMSDATTVVDSTNVGLKTISDDRVVVTATVNPYLRFTLSGNADNLGSLDQTTVTSSGSPNTVTIRTNAGNGWLAWAQSTSSGLASTAASHTIPSGGSVDGSPSTITAGTENYGLAVGVDTDSGTAGTGTVSVAGEYNAGGTQIGTLNNSYNLIASSDGPTDDDIISLTFRAAIGALTPAATDYTDTLVVVGAGNF